MIQQPLTLMLIINFACCMVSGYKYSVFIKRVTHNREVARRFFIEANETESSERPDIIYACMPTLEVSEQAVLYGLHNRIPVVVDIRELWPDNYLTVFPKITRPLVQVFLKNEFLRAYRILHNATAITASSPAYLDWGIKTGKRQGNYHDKWFPLGFAHRIKIKRLL
jgi:hypothetical protein